MDGCTPLVPKEVENAAGHFWSKVELYVEKHLSHRLYLVILFPVYLVSGSSQWIQLYLVRCTSMVLYFSILMLAISVQKYFSHLDELWRVYNLQARERTHCSWTIYVTGNSDKDQYVYHLVVARLKRQVFCGILLSGDLKDIWTLSSPQIIN
jgi:hypothetical protein